MKLFTIPFAGGSANYYNCWKQVVNRNINIVPIELKARRSRAAESLYENMNGVIFDIFEHIKEDIVYSPYVLLDIVWRH